MRYDESDNEAVILREYVLPGRMHSVMLLKLAKEDAECTLTISSFQMVFVS